MSKEESEALISKCGSAKVGVGNKVAFTNVDPGFVHTSVFRWSFALMSVCTFAYLLKIIFKAVGPLLAIFIVTVHVRWWPSL